MPRRRTTPQVQPIAPVFNPDGPSELRQVKSAKEEWSEFTLDDGTVLRVKPSVVDARWMKGQFGPDGDPLYLVRTNVVMSTIAPENLRKGAASRKKKKKKAKKRKGSN
jgi:hypothetical protein